MDFFSINNVMVNIPLGEGGYALSWIEAIGTIFGLLCIWCASREKIINYLFGLINVTLFAAIFFQIQLYASLLLQVFFSQPTFTAGTRGAGKTRRRRPRSRYAGFPVSKRWRWAASARWRLF